MPKIGQKFSKKKKGLFGTKKQAGAKLEKKKGFLPKKLTNSQKKEKKGTFPAKKKAGAELKNQKMPFFGQKLTQN